MDTSPAPAATPPPYGWHRCTECRIVQRLKDFRRMNATHKARQGRCLACEFPTCAACGMQSKRLMDPPSEKLRDYENATFPGQRCRWYCDKHTCNTQRPRECDLCHVMKEHQMFRKTANGHAVKTCQACEHPTCQHCGLQHPHSEQPLRSTARGRVGSTWYCNNKECQEAMSIAKTEKAPKRRAKK